MSGKEVYIMDYKEIMAPYQDLPGGIIEAFHAIQKEQSYLTEDAIIAAAGIRDSVKDATE